LINARIIIFQYNTNMRVDAATVLREAGYTVYAATSPERALEAAQTFRPNLIITDFPALVSTGVAGETTLTEAIRATPHLKDVLILNVPSSGFPQVHAHALGAGVSLSIPLSTPEELVEEVRRLV
jgi:CheY-like chemotaxis protein